MVVATPRSVLSVGPHAISRISLLLFIGAICHDLDIGRLGSLGVLSRVFLLASLWWYFWGLGLAYNYNKYK